MKKFPGINTLINLCCTLFMLNSYLLVPSECKAQEKSEANRDSIIAAAREIIALQKYCALITIDSTDLPSIRTMNPFPPEEDMFVWMATNPKSRKIQEIKNNPMVCLYYADHSQASGYVAITGKAILVNDMSEKMKRKRDYWEQAFPDWEKDMVLIKVIPLKMDVLNYKRKMFNDQVTWRVPSIEFENP